MRHSLALFGVFGGALLVFHVSEFALAYVFNRREVGLRSFLFSKPYAAAMAFASAEYAAEAAFAPALKTAGPALAISALGLGMVVAGEALRKAAIVTAASNFTHDIRMRRQGDHVLVTRGVYAWARHPGYLGWYLWAVGTQVLLVNPLSAGLFAYLSWRFFANRIAFEEQLLYKFFGAQYAAYAARVPTYLPGISPCSAWRPGGAAAGR